MRTLAKIMFFLALIFASTFIVLKVSGIISIEKIEAWLVIAKQASPIYVATVVIGLLFLDLFIAVPTLTITILAGYFLGAFYGGLSAIIGVSLAGFCGYFLSARYGEKFLKFVVREPAKRRDAMISFKKHGALVILFSRAMPILPEVSACMAGLSRMNFFKFSFFWLLSTVPYVAIASYAGSVSSLDNPKPAIFAAIGLMMFFCLGWTMLFGAKKIRF